MAEVLGLIAGEGVLPLLGARQARADGRPLVCVALRERADPALAADADEILWIQPGEVVRGLAFLREHGVREVVLAGKVSKQPLLDGGEGAGQDAEARRLLAELPDLRDTTLLSRLADWLGSAGIELLPQWALAPGLRAGIGSLGAVAPDANQQRDLAFGLRCARRLAELDIGQTVVVKASSVIAVEALEGTDATLRRGGALAPGAVAVKVARPAQDPRFDVPAFGLRTLEVLQEAGIGALGFEADATLVLEREAVVRAADAAGIALLGLHPEGPPP